MKKQIIQLATAATTMLMSPMMAQNVGISPTGAPPDNSAGLDVNFTNKGLLIPRVALTGANDAATIPSPATSLLVYNTGTGGLTPAGYYYNAGTPGTPKWVKLLITGTPSDAWLTTGNAGTTAGTHFLGTTDNVDLVFKTNNTERMRITNTGNVGIGTTSPTNRLQVANGDVRVGEINPLNTGVFPNYGRYLYFSGGPAGGSYDSDNSDPLWIARYNVAPDQTELRVNIGDNAVPQDAFVVGNYALGYNLFRVQTNGNVGIGTTAPLSPLHVIGQPIAQGWDGVYRSRCSHGSIFHLIGNYDGWDSLAVYIAGYNASNNFGSIYQSRAERVHIGRPERITVLLSNGNVGIGTTAPTQRLVVSDGTAPDAYCDGNTWVNASSVRVKENIKPLTNALQKVLLLQGVSFTWKDTKTEDIGLIAEEVAKVVPEVVPMEEDGVYAKGLKYDHLVGLLVEAIKELKQEDDKLKEENNKLKEENTYLKSKLSEQENKLKEENTYLKSKLSEQEARIQKIETMLHSNTHISKNQ